jgi:hypothetical protein
VREPAVAGDDGAGRRGIGLRHPAGRGCRFGGVASSLLVEHERGTKAEDGARVMQMRLLGMVERTSAQAKKKEPPWFCARRSLFYADE